MSQTRSVVNTQSPFAYLPPTLAAQYEAQSSIYFTVLGVWVWDSIHAFPEEYTIVRNRKSAPVIVYFLSRVFTLFSIISCIVFQGGSPARHPFFLSLIYDGWTVCSMADCRKLHIVRCIALAGSISTSSFLWLVRIRAICRDSKATVFVAGLLWLSVVGSMFPEPFSAQLEHIGSTKRCWVTGESILGSIIYAFAFLTAYDTVTFICISRRLMSGMRSTSTPDQKWTSRFKAFILGDGLPQFSKFVLRGGQKYYLATVGLDIVVIVLYFTAGASPIFHGTLILPTIALQNIFGCRVFRETLLDVSSVQEQRIELGNQSVSQIQRDIQLSDLFLNGKMGSSAEGVSLPQPVLLTHRL